MSQRTLQNRVAVLLEMFGVHMVAYCTNCEMHTTPTHWADGSVTPAHSQLQRLNVMNEVVDLITARCGTEVAISWFGTNTGHSTMKPVDAIREGHLDWVRAAAQCMIGNPPR